MSTILSCPAPTRTAAALLLGVVLALSGCSSTPHRAGSDPAVIRVTWNDYLGGNRLELVSESHTSKAEQYSAAREDASRKVQADVYMNGLLDFFELEGLTKLAQPGQAPTSGREVFNRSLEIQQDENVWHVAVGTRSVTQDRLVFQTCQQGFLELYNVTQAYQTVDAPLDAGQLKAQGR